MLDTRLPGRSEGTLCTVPSVFLERLEFLEEQGGGKEPAAAFVTTGFGGETRGSERRLRLTGVRENDHPEDRGRGRTAEGHALPLSESVQPPDAFDLGIAGPAEGCPADLHPGDPDQDVRAFLPGRSHGEDAGLGGRRTRRLYAELKQGISPQRRADDCVAWRRASRMTLLSGAGEMPASRP